MTSKPMLERMARKLCALDGHPENVAFEGAPMWRSYLDTARALLVDMREPSPAIVKAWTTVYRNSERPPTGWNDMIDAALVEKP